MPILACRNVSTGVIDVTQIPGQISSGTVTSVDVSGGTTGLTTSGGPISVSGVITIAGILGVANGGTGASGALAAGNVTSNGAALVSTAFPIPVSQGGTGTTTAFTAGSVVFAGAAGVYSQNNASLFWNNSTNQLGIGTNTPLDQIFVSSSANTTGGITISNLSSGTNSNAQLFLIAGIAGQGGLVATSTNAPSAGVFGPDSIVLSSVGRLALGSQTGTFIYGFGSTPIVSIGGTANTISMNGSFSTGTGTKAVVNGLNSNIVMPNNSFTRLTGPTLPFSLGGFSSINSDGTWLTVENTTANTMTLVNEDASSTATNRITTLTGGNVVMPANSPSAAQFIYDGTALRWIYVDPPVGNHTGTGANGQVTFWTGTNSQAGDNGLFYDNVNKRLGVGTVTPSFGLSVGSTSQFGVSASTGQLGANWNYGSAFTINGANSNDAVNVQAFSTGGTGASGNPWTGWDTAFTWTAGITYFFPAGFYSMPASPAWGKTGIRLIGDGFGQVSGGVNIGTVITNTGTGKVAAFDGGGTTTTGILVQDITFAGNASSADNGIYIANTVGSTFRRVRSNGAALAALYLTKVQESVFDQFTSSSNFGAYPKQPTNGILLDTASASTVNTFIGTDVVGVSGSGIVLQNNAFANKFIGGSVQSCNRGIDLQSGATRNSFDSMDLESNTVEDILITNSNENVFVNMLSQSASTNGVHLATGALQNVFTGLYAAEAMLIDSGAVGNVFTSVRFFNKAITNNGAQTYFVGCYDATNSKFFPDVSMQRFAVMGTDNTGTQSIANSTNTAVLFNTNRVDTSAGGIHSTSVNTSRFTVPLGGGGIWQLSASVAFATNGSGSRVAWVRKNGATLLGGGSVGNNVGTNANNQVQIPALLDIAVDGDYYEILCFQNSGGALSLGNDPLQLWCSALKVN